jgi:hypothetical protein
MALSRRQKKQLAKAAAANARPLAGSGDKLVNDLTVGDARHILRAEGGPLTPGLIASRLMNIAIVQGAVAWAIIAGGATVWHLLLPMVAQYFGMLIGGILCYLWWRPEGLKKDARGAVVLLVILAVIFAVTTFIRSTQASTAWGAQADLDARAMFDWVVDHKMHWPMLAGFILSMIDTRRRVIELMKHGPPYIGASLGCAMRVLIVVLGCFLIPFIAADWNTAMWNTGGVWVLWGVVVLAEFLSLGMHWDVQQRLKKLDGDKEEEKPSIAEATEDSHPLKF